MSATAVETLEVALLGNPNSGKTTLFNQLTGLRQKTGNFPGVTVEKIYGQAELAPGHPARITDLPGVYSIYPNTVDEEVVINYLTDKHQERQPEVVVMVVDAANLRRNMLFFSQIYDLGLPMVLALNMIDVADRAQIRIDDAKLSAELGIPVVRVNSRKGTGLAELKQAIVASKPHPGKPIWDVKENTGNLTEGLRRFGNFRSEYEAYLTLALAEVNIHLPEGHKAELKRLAEEQHIDLPQLQRAEVLSRYKAIDKLLKQSYLAPEARKSSRLTDQIDRVLTHRVWGFVVFLLILLLIFQAIFTWASWPMDLIDLGFLSATEGLKALLPPGLITDLLTEGVLPGVGGVVIFLPQIMLLFLFITILEETGYMSRVVFMMDRLMRPFGLNGQSVVPLISGLACAIPAIMSARSISNRKDRLITIFVTPFMSCSARLPVYTLLVGMVVPAGHWYGIIGYQAVSLLGLYLLGTVAALLGAWVMKATLSIQQVGTFFTELPLYKTPRWGNVAHTVYRKALVFVVEAGKIILAISIVLWALATYGPAETMENAATTVAAKHPKLSGQELDKAIASYKLEHSYAGIVGQSIEPVIAPLGYDWKIGIALLTSFAAREVFVGTLSTIYAVGEDAEEQTIRQRLAGAVKPGTNEPAFTPATSWSLLIFYVFAMQCMSTLAITRKETHSWKWPLLQLVSMTGLAYLAALFTYQVIF